MPISHVPLPDEALASLGKRAREQGFGRFFAQNTRLIRLETPSMAPLMVE